MKYRGMEMVTRNVSSLLPEEWDEMWGLCQKYNEMSRDYFEENVRCSKEVLLTYDHKHGNLVGMGAVEVYPFLHENKKVLIIFTGQVLLDPDYRGKNVMQLYGLNQYLKSKLRNPSLPCYWFFSSISYKSYLVMAKNFREFYPSPEKPTPSWTHGLMEKLAVRHYGDLWNQDKQVVHLGDYRRYKPWVAQIDSEASKNELIQFYLKINPNYIEADAAICLAPLTAENWKHVILRAFQRALVNRSTES